MKKSMLFILIPAAALAGFALWIAPRLPEWERTLAERLANDSARDFFDGSLRVEKVSLDRHLRIRLTGITGKFKTRQGPLPLELKSLGSRDPLFFLITGKPVRFVFAGMRPQGSPRHGISGTFTVRTGTAWSFEWTGNFGGSDLEDWQWLDPQNLAGATGAMKGTLTFRQTSGQEPEFDMGLEIPRPGGNIQARFFDLFLPYLPTAIQKERVQKIAGSRTEIHYDLASLKAGLPQGAPMKILLQIFIPDYNLKLSLNAILKIGPKGALSQIARLMGLIEVKS